MSSCHHYGNVVVCSPTALSTTEWKRLDELVPRVLNARCESRRCKIIRPQRPKLPADWMEGRIHRYEWYEPRLEVRCGPTVGCGIERTDGPR